MSKIFFEHPLMLGFDTMLRHVEKNSKCSDSYPPYNIEQNPEDVITIKIAVAGFTEEELSIVQEGNQLMVAGSKLDNPKQSEVVYLHRGISLKKFQRIFLLAEGVDPLKSYLENGILHIILKQIMPEKKRRSIYIEKKDNNI